MFCFELCRDRVSSIELSPSSSFGCFARPTGEGISSFDNTLKSIEVNLNHHFIIFINCTPVGLSPLISISKCNSVIVYSVNDKNNI